jgi:uncharacterized sulfatase
LLTGKAKEHKRYTFSLQTTRGIINGSDHYGSRSVADKKYRYIVNLTPDATFQNEATSGQLFMKWKEAAESDSAARRLTYRYQHRPAVELFDLSCDPFCINNIAGAPENGKILKQMDQALRAWMNACGDKGQETEMKALEHMPKKHKQ